jgi:trk system potassium uptake protein TrkA
MLKSEQNKQKEFAVIGLGRFGRAIVRALGARGFCVVGIDRDARKVQRVSEYCTQVSVTDSTDEDSLKKFDIPSFDAVIVAIGSDFESNLITTVALKALGARLVICKALSERQKEILLQVGADRVIRPESDAGQRLATELIAPNLLEQISFGEGYSVLEFRVPESMTGKTMAEIDLQGNYGANVVAIRHESAVTLSPQANQVLMKNDIMVVIGETGRIGKLAELN